MGPESAGSVEAFINNGNVSRSGSPFVAPRPGRRNVPVTSAPRGLAEPVLARVDCLPRTGPALRLAVRFGAVGPDEARPGTDPSWSPSRRVAHGTGPCLPHPVLGRSDQTAPGGRAPRGRRVGASSRRVRHVAASGRVHSILEAPVRPNPAREVQPTRRKPNDFPQLVSTHRLSTPLITAQHRHQLSLPATSTSYKRQYHQ
jgi:hypothetical protein